MPRFFKSHYKTNDEPDPELNAPRGYQKHDAAYWERPGLTSLIHAQLAEQPKSYADLRDLALDLGYAITSFYQTMSELRGQEAITENGGMVSAASEYTGEDWV